MVESTSRKSKELEPTFWGVLITLDHTPFYGVDSLRSAVENCIYKAVGTVPHWFESFPRGVGPVFNPDRDIHLALAAKINDYFDARFNYTYPRVSVLSGGILTELAWTDFWEATEFLTPERAQIHRDFIRDVALREGGGGPLSDISCALLLSPTHVIKTAPGGNPTGWLTGGPREGIELFNHCFRLTARNNAEYFPNLLLIDLEGDDEMGDLEIDLEAQLLILTNYLSDHLGSHTPIRKIA